MVSCMARIATPKRARVKDKPSDPKAFEKKEAREAVAHVNTVVTSSQGRSWVCNQLAIE